MSKLVLRSIENSVLILTDFAVNNTYALSMGFNILVRVLMVDIALSLIGSIGSVCDSF